MVGMGSGRFYFLPPTSVYQGSHRQLALVGGVMPPGLDWLPPLPQQSSLSCAPYPHSGVIIYSIPLRLCLISVRSSLWFTYPMCRGYRCYPQGIGDGLWPSRIVHYKSLLYGKRVMHCIPRHTWRQGGFPLCPWKHLQCTSWNHICCRKPTIGYHHTQCCRLWHWRVLILVSEPYPSFPSSLFPHPTVINLHILSPSSVSVKSGFDHDTTKDTQGVPYQFWPKPITFVQTSIVQFNMDTLLIYKDDYNLSKLITLICNLKL